MKRKRNRNTHPALTAFLVTLTLLLGATGAFTAVWNTRATLFGDSTPGIALEQTAGGVQLRVFDTAYAVPDEQDVPWLRLLPAPLRAGAVLLEAEAAFLGERLHDLIEQ